MTPNFENIDRGTRVWRPTLPFGWRRQWYPAMWKIRWQSVFDYSTTPYPSLGKQRNDMAQHNSELEPVSRPAHTYVKCFLKFNLWRVSNCGQLAKNVRMLSFLMCVLIRPWWRNVINFEICSPKETIERATTRTRADFSVKYIRVFVFHILTQKILFRLGSTFACWYFKNLF